MVEEAGHINLLVMPPWDNEDALATFLMICSKSQSQMTIWMRCKPGLAESRSDVLSGIIKRLTHTPSDLVNILLVDAQLAPERESGLYRAADAVFVDDDWVGIHDVIRRAYDCRLELIRGRSDLEDWIARDG